MARTDLIKDKLYQIIFGTETRLGLLYDKCLIVTILASVVVVVLDSMSGISEGTRFWLGLAEWCFTLLFTLEYLLRLWISPKPWAYARSFYGIVDLLAILPSYLALLFANAHLLMIVRVLRLLRVFRVLKLFRYLSEASLLLRSLRQSSRKILVFFFSVGLCIMLFATLMYLIEGPQHGFTSIPKAIYWAIVTITTVGYGDISPQTPLGQVLASITMLVGYSILAVPTGIVTAELSQEISRHKQRRRCPVCERSGHDQDALFCKYCGSDLPETFD